MRMTGASTEGPSEAVRIGCVAIVAAILAVSVPAAALLDTSVYLWSFADDDGVWHTEVLRMEVSEDDVEASRHDGLFAMNLMRYSSGRVVADPGIDSFVDPDDPYVRTVADRILSVTDGMSDRTRITSALNFVRMAIDYRLDDDQYGMRDYWATPAETLFSRQGDCEDTSILLCSILSAMGIPSGFVLYSTHAAVQVDCEGRTWRCETARSGPGQLGDISSKYAEESPYVFDVPATIHEAVGEGPSVPGAQGSPTVSQTRSRTDLLHF